MLAEVLKVLLKSAEKKSRISGPVVASGMVFWKILNNCEMRIKEILGSSEN